MNRLSFPRRGRAATASRAGFTLVEMLVTVAVVTVILLALVNVFAWVGDRVASGRAVIEMSGSLAGTAPRLQTDLDGLTCPIRPFPLADSALGYFEYIERSENDDTGRNLVPPLSIQGDRDDILAFTSHSAAEPFLGQWLGNLNAGNPALPPVASVPQTVASSDAEIIWWAQHVDTNNDFAFTPEEQISLVLHRRVLPIRPDLNNAAGFLCELPTYFAPAKASYSMPGEINLLATDIRRLYNTTDISFRLQRVVNGSNLVIRVIANSLADLTQRENRWLRHPLVLMNPTYANLVLAPPPTFPYPLDLNPLSITALGFSPHHGHRLGEDVILSNLLAFDVRAYDPSVRQIAPAGQAVLPADPGWTPALAAIQGNVIGFGGYVDLNYAYPFVNAGTWFPACNSLFSGGMTTKSQLTGTGYAVYDTWSYYYEHDGVDQYNANPMQPLTDEGTDGLDNDGTNGTDDPGERETAPPYPIPLRGLQVQIRVYDPDSRQLRQATVKSNFTPD